MPYDMPVPGYANDTRSIRLRLFSAKATHEFDLNYFNHGDYMLACQDKALTENITKVLYPKDDFAEGRELAAQAGVPARLRLAAGHSRAVQGAT